MKTKIMLTTVAMTLSIFADGPFVAWNERTNVTVGVQAGPFAVEPGGVLDKVGGGTYAISPNSLWQATDAEVGVREGALALTAGAVPASTLPEALAEAALHLDANANVVLADAGSANVTQWLDVRDTGGSQTHYYGFSMTGPAGSYPGAAASALPQLKTTDGKKSVYFNGFGSGSWMQMRKPDGTAVSIQGIWHLFFVRRFETGEGYLFGNADTPIVFHPSDTGSFFQPTTTTAGFIGGRHSLDGEPYDMFAGSIRFGLHLLSLNLSTATGRFNGFFNDRDFQSSKNWKSGGGDRVGGDHLCEVVVFTNRLDEASVCQITEYLRRKWISSTSGALIVNSATGTTVSVGADVGKVRLTGGGEVESSGAGARIELADDFAGTIAAGPQSATLLRADAPVSVRSGSSVVAQKDGYEFLTLTGASAASGSFDVSGGGAVEVRTVPEDVEKLTVDGGTLVLASAEKPQASSVVIAGDTTVATMSNAGFEENMSALKYAALQKGQTMNGWTSIATEDNRVFFVNPALLAATDPSHNYLAFCNATQAPEGQALLVLRFGGGVMTPVAFAADGRYELTFKSNGRAENNGSLHLDLGLISEDGSQTNWFGGAVTVTESQKNCFRTHRVLTPRLAAGNYTFVVKPTDSGDQSGAVDDFRFTLVTRETDEETVAVPNGDFERVSGDNPATYGGKTATGWTFAGSVANDATIVLRAMTDHFNAGSARYGDAQLAFFGATGKATSEAFAVPPGTYRLRGDFGGLASGSARGAYAGNALVKATISVLGNEPIVSTVTYSARRSVLVRETFADTVTVPENATVTIALEQRADGAGALIDNLELVRVSPPALGDELISNGSFENSASSSSVDGWTWVSGGSCGGDVNSLVRFLNPKDDNNFGFTKCDGNVAARVLGHPVIWQSVAFAEAGTYRLSFWVRGRQDKNQTDLNFYSKNGALAYLAKDGVTNELLRTQTICSSNFLERTTLFIVPSAGTYDIGFRGLNATGGDTEFFLDLVSVKKWNASGVPTLPNALSVDVATGSKLHLDYTGVVQLKELRLGGRRVSGEISAAKCPNLAAYLEGPGEIYVRPNGLVLIFR